MTISSQLQQLNLPTPPDVSQQKKDIKYLRRARRDITRKINKLENELQNSIVSETIIAHWEEFYHTQTDEKVQEAFIKNCQKWEEEKDCFNLNLLLAAHRVQCSRKLEAMAA